MSFSKKVTFGILLSACLPALGSGLFLVNERDGKVCRAAPEGLSAPQVVSRMPGAEVVEYHMQALPAGVTLHRVEARFRNKKTELFDFTETYGSCDELASMRRVPRKPTPTHLKNYWGDNIFLLDTQCQFDTSPLAKNASQSNPKSPDYIIFGCWYDEGAFVRLHWQLQSGKGYNARMSNVEILDK